MNELIHLYFFEDDDDLVEAFVADGFDIRVITRWAGDVQCAAVRRDQVLCRFEVIDALPSV